MQLYLQAKTVSKRGYTPDWICIEFKHQSKKVRLTMDIQGETSYSTTKLYTQTKGELIPSEYRVEKNGKTKFKDLYQLSEEKLEDYLQMFNHKLSTAKRVIVGIYLTDNTNYEETLKTLDPSEEFTDYIGSYGYQDDFGKNHTVEFEFEYKFIN